MRSSLPTALMAIISLSNTTSALWLGKRTTTTVTILGCEATSTSSVSDILLEKLNIDDTSIEPILVLSTVTVVPVPMTTAAGVLYTGYESASESGSAYPSGPSNHTATFTPSGSDFNTQTSSREDVTFTIPTEPLFTPNPSITPSLVTATSAALITSEALSSVASSSGYPSPTVLPSSTSISTSSVTPIRSETSASIPFLRGVNLGGWLILEKWMGSDAFSGDFSEASDQWTFDSISGAEAALQAHWSTYFTEDDIKAIAATGINALRIPIGYWAYDNANTPYIKGADAYLEKAIGWARNLGMKVWVDCHGSPGSQNGFDNSGHSGNVEWQSGDNLEHSISVLKTMAEKYGAAEYADVVVGLELVNEPISWGSNDFAATQSWAREAYAAVKSVTDNANLVIVMHDSFVTPLAWTDLGGNLIGGGAKTFGLDTHLYQLWGETNNALNQDQHITTACGWASDLATSNAIMPTYVGEWSTATNICVNPDGSTTAGTSCSVSGCQCQSADFSDWNDVMVSTVRKFVEAQLDVFESSSSGYFIWSAKGPGGWGFMNGIQKGTIPNPVTSREFPSQCGSGYSQRRNERGSLVI